MYYMLCTVIRPPPLCIPLALFWHDVQLPPASSRPCNRFPCTAKIASWEVGDWGLCTPLSSPVQPCDVVPGARTRTRTCRSSDGLPVADTECAGWAPEGAKPPPTTQPCVFAATCICLKNGACSSPPLRSPGVGQSALSTFSPRILCMYRGTTTTIPKAPPPLHTPWLSFSCPSPLPTSAPPPTS